MMAGRIPGCLTVAALACVLASWPAKSATLRESDGTQYRVNYNRHGAILRSGRAIVYLGVHCDARSVRYGNGRWSWANGGVEIRLERQRLLFARQELELEDHGRCRR